MGLGVGNLVSIGGGTIGGGGGTSGITSINSQTGPAVSFIGVNGAEISASGNVITVDAAGASGVAPTKYSATFSAITSGIFTHALNTLDVIVQVYDGIGGGSRLMIPDEIIVENLNQVSVLFNTPQTGRIVII